MPTLRDPRARPELPGGRSLGQAKSPCGTWRLSRVGVSVLAAFVAGRAPPRKARGLALALAARVVFSDDRSLRELARLYGIGSHNVLGREEVKFRAAIAAMSADGGASLRDLAEPIAFASVGK